MNRRNLVLFSGGSLSTVAVLSGLAYYTPTIDFTNWLQLLLLLLGLLICQFRGVAVGNKMKFSLSTTFYMALIFVYGIGEAMWLAIAINLIYGLYNNRSFLYIVFNTAQRALSALLVGIMFSFLHSSNVLELPQSIWPMLVCIGGYSLINHTLVTLFSVILKNESLAATVKVFKPKIWFNSFLYGYIGIVFSFFINHWQLPGLIVFGILLLGISEVIHANLTLISEQQRRIKAEKELILDSKTKVFNYRFLSKWLDEKPATNNVGLLFIDIDDFKTFNDVYGHDVGDKALKLVAQNIMSSVRKEDRVIRFGGEEFVVILANTKRQKAIQIAQRIQKRITAVSSTKLDQEITVSIGIAVCPDDAMERLDLLQAADMAMYRAKALGKNQYCTNV